MAVLHSYCVFIERAFWPYIGKYTEFDADMFSKGIGGGVIDTLCYYAQLSNKNELEILEKGNKLLDKYQEIDSLPDGVLNEDQDELMLNFIKDLKILLKEL